MLEQSGAEGASPLNQARRKPALKLSPAPMVSVGSTTTGCDPVTLAVALYKSAARSARDDEEGDTRGEGVEGLFEGGPVGYFFDFIPVGLEQVDRVEEDREDAVPVAEGLVVGVEREGVPRLLEVIEELGKAGV